MSLKSLSSLLADAADEAPKRLYLDGPLGSLSCREAWTWALSIGEWLLSIPQVTSRRAVGICGEVPDATALVIWAAVHRGVSVVFLPKCADVPLMRSRMLEAGVDYLLTDDSAHRGEQWCADVAEVVRTTASDCESRNDTGYLPRMGSDEDAAFLFQTSGTSGEPKWVRCEYSKCLAAVNSMRRVGALDHARAQTVFLTPPLFHSYGLSTFLEYTSVGAAIVFPRGTSPFGPAGELRGEDQRTRVTAIEGVPYFYSQMAKLVHRLNVPGVRHFGVGGGALDPQVMARILEVHPRVTVSVRYGLTETPSVVSHKVFHPPHTGQWSSSGRVIPAYEVTIESENGQPVAAYQEGEIVVRGSCVCACRGQSGSELRTGDIGYLTESGELVVVGRNSSFIKCRGFRLSPEQIESVIASCPGVEDCRVRVIDSRLIAELVHVDALLARDVLAFVAARLPIHAVPEKIVRVPAVARTPSGKIMRHRAEQSE